MAKNNMSRRGFLRLLGGGVVGAALAPLAASAAPATVVSTVEFTELVGSPALMWTNVGADVVAGITEGMAKNGLSAMPGLDHLITTGHYYAARLGYSPEEIQQLTVDQLTALGACGEGLEQIGLELEGELEQLYGHLPPPTTQQLHERLLEAEGEITVMDGRLDLLEGELEPDLYRDGVSAA